MHVRLPLCRCCFSVICLSGTLKQRSRRLTGSIFILSLAFWTQFYLNDFYLDNLAPAHLRTDTLVCDLSPFLFPISGIDVRWNSIKCAIAYNLYLIMECNSRRHRELSCIWLVRYSLDFCFEKGTFHYTCVLVSSILCVCTPVPTHTHDQGFIRQQQCCLRSASAPG